MNIRKRRLQGWYPGRADEIRELLGGWERGHVRVSKTGRKAVSGVAPHAGWMFSGLLSFNVLRCFPSDVETIAVVGGHLPAGGGLYAAFEDGYETPMGIIEADSTLLDFLRSRADITEDRSPDNTVEIQLPLIQYLFPEVRVLWLRAAPSASASVLGGILSDYAKSGGRSTAVLGSTDLTHYGASYGFSPQGSGEKAERWVREVNDRMFIDALLEQNTLKALELGVKERSACSAGGAAAASAFAAKLGINKGRLLGYSTSLDVHRAESFVGYAGIVYEHDTSIQH
ncbi:MAG: AmmeMemoRadiSam system protein B [Spirochaetales bacterium]|nr:MAG: AmmeMemoRadiSam system protein B [Spirochaetales bacterium]